MPPLPITEALIRQHTAPESFERGRTYARHGAVDDLTRRGDALEALVEGSEPLPYRVRVQFDGVGVTEATCTCAYEWGGWCKHIAATLLAYLAAPQAVEERPEPADLLHGLDRDQLTTVLLRLIEQDPPLAGVVEREVAALTVAPPPASAPAGRRSPVDTASFRRQVRDIVRGQGRLHGSEAYWALASAVAELRRVLEQARAFIRAGDGRSGLQILDAITEEFSAGYEQLDDSEGEGYSFLTALGAAWAEALLDPDVTPTERRQFGDKLKAWQRDLGDFGVDDAFSPALQAAEEGWDAPRVRRLLRGEATGGEEEVENDEAADTLVTARLNVLEREGRKQEFLHLAAAMGRADRYAGMLVQLGRIDEAVAYALERLATADAALALAQQLREGDRQPEALRIGERGLTLEGAKAQLAVWTRDLAAGMGERERALAAARVALREEASLANYLRAQEIAGADWPRVREAILAELRRVRSYYPQGQVDIFLHEGLLEDAMRAVENAATHTLVEQVVDAVLTSHPQWAIRMSRAQAEPIMNDGRAQYYEAAAGWLGKARAAYLAAGREAEWRAYRADLLDRHHRKYKLRPLIEALA